MKESVTNNGVLSYAISPCQKGELQSKLQCHEGSGSPLVSDQLLSQTSFFFLHPPNMLRSSRHRWPLAIHHYVLHHHHQVWKRPLTESTGSKEPRHHVNLTQQQPQVKTCLNQKGCDVKKKNSGALTSFFNQYFSHMSRLKRYILYLSALFSFSHCGISLTLMSAGNEAIKDIIEMIV